MLADSFVSLFLLPHIPDVGGLILSHRADKNTPCSQNNDYQNVAHMGEPREYHQAALFFQILHYLHNVVLVRNLDAHQDMFHLLTLLSLFLCSHTIFLVYRLLFCDMFRISTCAGISVRKQRKTCSSSEHGSNSGNSLSSSVVYRFPFKTTDDLTKEALLNLFKTSHIACTFRP